MDAPDPKPVAEGIGIAQPDPHAYSRPFLLMATAGLFLGSLFVILIMLSLAPEQVNRTITPAAVLLVSSASWALVYRGNTATGTALLAYGAWLTVTAGAAANGGVRSTVIVAYPVLILFAGWLLGIRSAMAIMLLSLAASFGFMAAENWLPPLPPTPTLLYWLIQNVVFLLAGGATVYLLRNHRRHLEDTRRLAADLEGTRARAESADALRRHKELLDRTGRMAMVGGWEIDAASGELTWTDETFRIHDLEPGAMPTVEQAIAYYAPEARPSIEQAVQQALSNGIAYDLELPMFTAKGRRIWVRALCEPQVEDGRVVRLSGAFQDITAHRLTDEQLENSLNNLQRTLEATDDGIFGYDGTDPQGRLLFANRRFFEIWKMDGACVENTTRSDIIAAARKLFPDPDAGVRRISEILAMGTLHEDKVYLNDGRVLFRRSIPLLEGSQVSRVWSFRDITAEEKAKAELVASRDDAQRANAAKSEFLSRMSHELRTPMHAIMGMIGLAQRRMVDTVGIDQLAKAKGAADHLLSVINDILDLSKIEAGHLTLESANFTLDDLLGELAGLFSARLVEKGLTLEFDVEPELRRRPLRGDSLRLRQILLNLLGNAVKFSERGTIRLGIRVGEVCPGRVKLHFEVIDQGIGIAAKDTRRIFDVFEQADGSTTRRYGGTGLGLAICKRLVETMDGQIDVDSQPGLGSNFHFTAWMQETHGTASRDVADGSTAAEERLRTTHSRSRILLVDDDAAGRDVAQALLDIVDMQVTLAVDGAEALRLATQNRYDLILMDMRMPRMNGIEATRAIRGDSINSATPILAMTAHAFAEDRQTCMDAGMNDHIPKPVMAQELYEAMLRWLGTSPDTH